MNKWVMVDIEADGPCPGLYSMLEIGAVICDKNLDKTFHIKILPDAPLHQQEALKVIGYTREQTLSLAFGVPAREAMVAFSYWLKDFAGNRPMFISDNNGFDWQFVNYYFWKHLEMNPFGHSSTNLGSLYKGLVKTTTKNFKHLRKTRHTHNPVDDCMGNVESLIYMIDKMGLDFKL